MFEVGSRGLWLGDLFIVVENELAFHSDEI